jgi:hypothetical protein
MDDALGEVFPQEAGQESLKEPVHVEQKAT